MTIKAFWAVGSRVADPLAEAGFFEALGAERKSVDRRGDDVVVFMTLGGFHFHLTNRLRYETDAPAGAGWPIGLAHFVLDVTDMTVLADKAVSLGATQVHPRLHLTAAHGEMKAAFLKSPGGILFQLVERLREADADYAKSYKGPSERIIE